MTTAAHKPLVVHAHFLTPEDRHAVAAHTMAWAGEKAAAVLDEVVVLGGAIEELAAWTKTATDPAMALRALAGSEAQLLASLRVARTWAGLAGAYLPVAVRDALAAFPEER